MDQTPGSFVDDISDLPVGSARRVTHGGRPLLIVRHEEGVRLFSAICTHEGCLVGWNDERNVIRCPCHGGVFDVSGSVLEGPPPRPLLELEARVEDGKIYLIEE